MNFSFVVWKTPPSPALPHSAGSTAGTVNAARLCRLAVVVNTSSLRLSRWLMWREDGVNFSGMEKTQARLEKPEAMKRLSKPVLKSGRPAGLLNLIPRPVAKEIARAAAECRPGGFGEFLIEMSRSDVAGDRAIFAGCVLRLLPPVQTQAGGPAVTINLGWLTGRAVAGSSHVTVDQPVIEQDNADV